MADIWQLTTVFGGPISVRTCTYRKPDGAVCNSPALRGQRFCYFHLDPVARRFKAELDQAYCLVRLARERERGRRRRPVTHPLATS